MRWILALLLLSACQQNPYQGRAGVQAPPPKRDEKPKVAPKGAYALEVPDLMAFSEGVRTEVELKGAVPTPGEPRFEIIGMPAGMVFDPATRKLVWTPDFQAANDPNEPTVTTRFYNLEVRIFSTVDALVSLSKTAVLQVKDTPQPLNIKSPLAIRASEGQMLNQLIDFEDLEYPAGPFDALLEGFPVGTRLEWPDRRVPRFNIVWEPGFETVKGAVQKLFGGKVTLYNPRGKRIQFDAQWTIVNTLSAPRVMGPANVDQGPTVEFMTMAEDVNGEESPQWRVVNGPSGGDFRVQTQNASGAPLPRSLGLVTWKRIPRNLLGTTVTVDLQACVKSSTCSNFQVRIQANANAGVAP